MSDGDRPGEADPGTPGPASAGSVRAGPALLLRREFSAVTVTALRHAVAARVAFAGVSGRTADGFVVAVHELVTNAVRHGGGSGLLELRMIADTLVCEVIDHGGTADGLPVQLPQADQPGGRGLWLAHHLTEGLMLTRRPDGVTASVSVCLPEQPQHRRSRRPWGRPAVTSMRRRPEGSSREPRADMAPSRAHRGRPHHHRADR